jgi:hypothetical protein
MLSAVVIGATGVESVFCSFTSDFSSGQTLRKNSSCSSGNGISSRCLTACFQRFVRPLIKKICDC